MAAGAWLQARHPRVRFAGWQRGSELARHYASADVCLVPGMNHSFGNATLEAMASGLSVVAFDAGAASLHVSDGRNGFLAQPGPGAEESFFQATRRPLAGCATGHAVRQQAWLAALRAGWDTVLAGFESRLHTLASHAPAVQGHAVLA